MRAHLMVLALTLASIGPAAAQVPVPASAVVAAPDPARLAAARELIEAMRLRDRLRLMTGPMMNQMMQGAIAGMAGGSPQFAANRAADPYFDERMRRVTKIVSSEVAANFAQMMPDLMETYSAAYARVYTVTELKAQTEFYRSPVGQTVAAKTPDVMAAATGDMMKTLLPRVAAMAERMKALGPKIEAALADLPPPPKPAG